MRDDQSTMKCWALFALRAQCGRLQSALTASATRRRRWYWHAPSLTV